MMFLMLLAQDKPEWYLIARVVGFLVFLFGFFVWGLILEFRYFSPYILINTSDREKWRRAAILALLQTSMFPILSLMFGPQLLSLMIDPRFDQWPFNTICFGIWVIILSIITLLKRLDYERRIKSYRRIDKMIKDKNSKYQRFFSSPFTSWIRIFMTADLKRFFSEGFPDDINQETDDVS